jgi:polar amino acid transport system permease protein
LKRRSVLKFIDIFLQILGGLQVTVSITLLGMLFAVPFALVAGIAQWQSRGTARLCVTGLIEFWRSTPVLVLLFLFYYSLPTFGIRLPNLLVGAMVLGTNIGAYGSQVVRASLQSLPKGQVEAGRALGMHRWQILLLIEFPQAVVLMLPSCVNLSIQLVKGTAAASLITLTDMTFQAKEIGQLYYNPPLVYSALLLSYFVICYPMTVLGRALERAFSPGSKGDYEF